MSNKKNNAYNLLMIIFISFLCFCIGFLLAEKINKKEVVATPEAEIKTAFKTGCFQTYTALKIDKSCKVVNIQALSDSLYKNWRGDGK